MIDSCLNYFSTSLLQNSMLTDHNSAAAILNGGLGIPGWNMPGLQLGGIIGDLNPYTRQQQPQPQDILPTTEAPSHQHLWSVRCRQLSVPRVHSSMFESRVFFLSQDQQSGIHCLMIYGIQLLTLNIFSGTWKPIYLGIHWTRSVSASRFM